MNAKPEAKQVQRDGVWTDNSLSADFIYIRAHPSCSDIHRIQTASGEHWVHESELIWDPPAKRQS